MKVTCVSMARSATKMSLRVTGGRVDDSTFLRRRPVDGGVAGHPAAILHEDADLVVIDKPAGLVVHPAAGHADGTLVNALLFHVEDLSGIGGELRPGSSTAWTRTRAA